MTIPALIISVLLGFLIGFNGSVDVQGSVFLSSAEPLEIVADGEVGGDVLPAMPIGDALNPLGPAPRVGVVYNEELGEADDPRPGFWETSEYMLGRVGVLVVFVESDGGLDPDVEDWDSWRMNLVMGKIRSGLSWWANNYPFDNPPLEFLVRSVVGYTKYEPIIRNSTDETLWVPDVLASIECGSGENYYLRAVSCANQVREEWGTDWAFLIFVVDSLKDEDGMFANPPRFAYAYINGPYMVLTYDNDNWGIDRMDRVVAHEAGHIFGATDEYDENPQNGGYLYELDDDGSGCIMDKSEWCISSGTKRQIGWVDDDSDGYPDILENEPIIIIEEKPSNITDDDSIKLKGTVKLNPFPCRRPYCRSVTINKVAPLNSTGELYALDGEFDSPAERFLLIYNATSAGRHRISVSFSESMRKLIASYSQTVLYTYVLVMNSSGPEAERVDAGSTQAVDFQLKWAHDESAVESGEVIISGLPAENRGDGWFGITVTKNDVGEVTLNVDSLSVYLKTSEGEAMIHKFLMMTRPVHLIFDRVVIELSSPRPRFDVGSYAEINYQAYYEYDRKDFVGMIYISPPMIQSEVGKYTYRVADIRDELYGLKAYTSNSIDIIFDKVIITLSASRQRIDVGSTAPISIDAKYAYDSQRFSGEVYLSNSLTQTQTGKYIYRAVEIRDEEYGLSRFETNQVEVIFDRVVVELSAPPRAQAGKAAPVTYSAHYDYDGERLIGDVVLNRDTAYPYIGKVKFTATEVRDRLYGLESFISNEVEVIFDSLSHSMMIDTLIPFVARTTIRLSYLSDGAPVTGAEVVLNDAEMSEVSPGEYQQSITTLSPIANLSIRAMIDYFDPYTAEAQEIMIGNVVLYIGITLLAIFVAIRRAQKRRRPIRAQHSLNE